MNGVAHMPKTITLQQLRDKGACAPQLELFGCIFDNSVEVTVELCVKHAAMFNWSWAARNLLAGSGYVQYAFTAAEALRGYTVAKGISSDAWHAYIKILASAFAQAYLSMEDTK
jgi:hypothetical protein